MVKTTSTYDLIVGLGRSGLSMARFLNAQGRKVIAADSNPALDKAARELGTLNIETRLGSHDQTLFDNAARIIPSPGVPLTLPQIRRAVSNGVPVTGELDIFSRYNKTRMIAVTGTNGKTTTTTLIAEMIRACGFSCFVGGNIGTPLVDYLMAGTPADWIVAEISSFQLDLAREFSPDIGLLLNITEDHLDRYPSFDAYETSKWSLFSRQTPGQTAVVNRAIPGFEGRSQTLLSKVLTFSSGTQASARINDGGITICTDGTDLRIQARTLTRFIGIHNLENAAAATLAVLGAGGRPDDITKALEAFTPLPHRVTPVGEVDGVRYFDDSKATNVDAVIRALSSFSGNIILILGGREKDTDFTPLIPEAASRVRQILAIGEATGHICQAFEGHCPVTPCSSMAEAVKTARRTARPKDVVLLSPACASFDMYANYEERGKDFAACVAALTAGEVRHG